MTKLLIEERTEVPKAARDLLSILTQTQWQLDPRMNLSMLNRVRALEKRANVIADLGFFFVEGELKRIDIADILPEHTSAAAFFRDAIDLYKMLGLWYKIAKLAIKLIDLHKGSKFVITGDIKWGLVCGIEEAVVLARTISDEENATIFSDCLLELEKIC